MELTRMLLAGIVTGVLFMVLDGLIGFASNRVLKRYVDLPIWRTQFNPAATAAVDLIYGLILAAIFATIHAGIPGEGLAKGVFFGVILWFLRVVMMVSSVRAMLNVPDPVLAYWLMSGLMEMLVLGGVLGLIYRG